MPAPGLGGSARALPGGSGRPVGFLGAHEVPGREARQPSAGAVHQLGGHHRSAQPGVRSPGTASLRPARAPALPPPAKCRPLEPAGRRARARHARDRRRTRRDARATGRRRRRHPSELPLAGLIFGMFIGISEEEARDLNSHSERFESAQFHQRPEVAEEENLYLYAVCRELVARRRANPLDPHEDIVSALLEVRVDGAPLDDEFIAGSIRQLLIAAHVAPSAAIASAIRHVAEDPALQDQLRGQPDLIPCACDELLRLYTPNQGFARTATRTTGGSRAGDRGRRTGRPRSYLGQPRSGRLRRDPTGSSSAARQSTHRVRLGLPQISPARMWPRPR